MVLAAAVTAGELTAREAWPEYFSGAPPQDGEAFPATDADMSGFRLEEATPESYAADVEALIAASRQVTIREAAPPPQPPFLSPHPEWT